MSQPDANEEVLSASTSVPRCAEEYLVELQTAPHGTGRAVGDFEDHNAVWNEWVDFENPPVRACVGAVLWQPDKVVEIMVTAEK